MDQSPPPSEDPGLVRFEHSEIIVMISHLANAMINANNATAALAANDRHIVYESLAKSGEQIDEILKIMRSKLGEEVVPL